eukprot:6045148-Amphidinium_carterae.1
MPQANNLQPRHQLLRQLAAVCTTVQLRRAAKSVYHATSKTVTASERQHRTTAQTAETTTTS